MRLIPSFSVAMDIYDVLYLSYLIPESKVRPYIPEPLTPAGLHDGMVYLSVVCFHSKDVRVAGFPFIKFSYDQINIRTYVKDPGSGKNGVLFLHSGITSPVIAFSTNILGFPWENIPFRLRAVKDGNNRYMEYRATGTWRGIIDISVKEDAASPACNDLPPDFINTVQYITSPGIGFYNTRGGVLRFEVKHTEIKPHIGNILHIDFPFLISSGLLMQHEMGKPDNILIADKATFTIFLPPQRIRTEKYI